VNQLLHALNPLNWHWQRHEGYVMGSSVTASIFGALTADQVTAWGGAAVALAVGVWTAFKSQQRSQGALDAIHAANLEAIRERRPVPYPDFLPPSGRPKPASQPSPSPNGAA
jgi:hypothetical protein